MNSGQFFIIGLGNIGMPLIRMLSHDFRLTCIDLNKDALAQAREIRGEGIRTIVGDATSRLVLERAGLSQADTVVITTSEEKVNLEVARVLHDHFPGVRTLAVGITPVGINVLKSLGVEVENIFSVSATGLRNRLEHRTKAVHGIGLGQNEILEVEVDQHSRLANHPVGKLRPKNWRWGLIYREGKIIIPTPSTIVRPKDRVVILGDPKVIKTIAKRLSFNFLDFPLEYGDTAIVFLTGEDPPELFGEIGYLATTLPLERFVFLSPGGTPPPEELLQLLADKSTVVFDIESKSKPTEALEKLLAGNPYNPGLFIMPPAALYSHRGSLRRNRRLVLDIIELAGCPLLLAGGTFPYARAAVPCLESRSCQNALEAALEVSAGLNNVIEALVPVPSKYIASEDEFEKFHSIKKTISDLGLVFKASLRKVELQGNPLHATRQSLPQYNLQVIELSESQRKTFLARLFQVDLAWRMVHQAPVSSLLIPSPETVL